MIYTALKYILRRIPLQQEVVLSIRSAYPELCGEYLGIPHSNHVRVRK